MAKRVNYTVNSPRGRLNVRERPSLSARVLRELVNGEKVRIDPNADVPDDWKAVEGGGYVKAKFLE